MKLLLQVSFALLVILQFSCSSSGNIANKDNKSFYYVETQLLDDENGRRFLRLLILYEETNSSKFDRVTLDSIIDENGNMWFSVRSIIARPNLVKEQPMAITINNNTTALDGLVTTSTGPSPDGTTTLSFLVTNSHIETNLINQIINDAERLVIRHPMLIIPSGDDLSKIKQFIEFSIITSQEVVLYGLDQALINLPNISQN